MKPWDTARAFQVCGEETPKFVGPNIVFVQVTKCTHFRFSGFFDLHNINYNGLTKSSVDFTSVVLSILLIKHLSFTCSSSH